MTGVTNSSTPPNITPPDLNLSDGFMSSDSLSPPFQADPPRPPLFFVQDDAFFEVDAEQNAQYFSDKTDDYIKDGASSSYKNYMPYDSIYNSKNRNTSAGVDAAVNFSSSSISNEPKYFSLSPLGLTNVSQIPIIDDFTFIVGGNEYHCNRFLASFISPVITRVFLADVNTSKFVIDIDDTEKFFGNILALAHGDIIQITEENALFLLQVATILGNDEMMESFSSKIPSLHEGNAVDLYLRRVQYKLETKQEIKYIASNFPKITFDSLLKLSPSQLAEIVGNESLRIRNEDSFFQTICNYIDAKGEDSNFLLGYINLPYLSEEIIPAFLEKITPENINGMIWETICDRLKLQVTRPDSKKKKKKLNGKESEKRKQFNGIISKLSRKTNIKKIVKITASSFKNEDLYVLTNRELDGYWSSYNLPSSWVKFYFKNTLLKIDEYSLETANLPPSHGHLISWVLEASNDDQEWFTLDSQYNLVLHAGREMSATFQCDKSGYYQYFRIKQCGLNDKGDNTMILKAVEFFGRVKPTK
ncbi:hypothetical protein TRFO_27995 [Tritrichomonas foetus]|uniref:BTB domain-containing protein n=1 Tax=Tritrichomonas foetus TaxID=1144522 RepID=A0A1J4K4C9_9EUKA|nr:hypothetical protein TRFO_27995 [Tritrichomonas foetus]|eukprot:OHT04542.1 hypothetical protein TRFO_27995 [Tritrichomonas foetus]